MVVSQSLVMPTRRVKEKAIGDDESSVTSDEDCEEAWEWRRLYLAADGGFWDLL